MTQETTRVEHGELAIYDPEKGLKTIATSEAGEKHWRRAKDATKLVQAIEAKVEAQADYIVWRDGVVEHGGDRKSKLRNRNLDPLPAADPGDVVAHRWRKRLTHKVDGRTVRDDGRIASVLEDARLRCVRICEQQNANTIRGTEGTGEFERYTPAVYIEAVRLVLGDIDLDPATSEMAQAAVQARKYFTAATNGLAREWNGRVFLNPPYHRELAPKFIDKLIEEYVARRTTAAIVLTNNCTDTEWFLAAAQACTAICFTNGRIKFTTPKGDEVLPTQGQAFFYYGNDVARFASVFARIGFGVVPRWSFDEGST